VAVELKIAASSVNDAGPRCATGWRPWPVGGRHVAAKSSSSSSKCVPTAALPRGKRPGPYMVDWKMSVSQMSHEKRWLMSTYLSLSLFDGNIFRYGCREGGMVEEWGCKAKTPSVRERIRHVRFHFSVTRYLNAKRSPA